MLPATKKHKAPVLKPAAAKKKSRPEPKAMPKPGSVPVSIEAEETPVLALLRKPAQADKKPASREEATTPAAQVSASVEAPPASPAEGFETGGVTCQDIMHALSAPDQDPMGISTLELNPKSMLQVNSMEDVPTEVLDEPDDEFDNVEPSDGQFPDMPASVEETPDALDWCSLFNIQKEIWEKLGRPLRVALPRVGVDGFTTSFLGMEVDFIPNNIYDLEDGYRDCLIEHYKEAGVDTDKLQIHLGPEEGEHRR